MGKNPKEMQFQGDLYYYRITIKINPASADPQNYYQVFISLFVLNYS